MIATTAQCVNLQLAVDKCAMHVWIAMGLDGPPIIGDLSVGYSVRFDWRDGQSVVLPGLFSGDVMDDEITCVAVLIVAAMQYRESKKA